MKSSLRKPFDIIIIGILTVTAIALLARNHFIFREERTKEIRSHLQLLADSEAEALQAKLENIVQDMQGLALNPYVWDLNLRETILERGLGEEYRPGEILFRNHLDILDSISRINRKGIILGRHPEKAAILGEDLSNEIGIQFAAEKHKSSIYNVVDVPGKPSLAICIPILDHKPDNGNYIGTIRSIIHIESLDVRLERLELPGSGHAWLEDSEHRIIAHPGGKHYGKLHEHVHTEYPRLIVHSPLEVLGNTYHLGISLPLASVIGPVNNHMRNTYLLIFLIILMLGVFGYYRHLKSRDSALLSAEREHLKEISAHAEALKTSEERLKKILDNIPGMVYQFVLHTDGSYSVPFVSERIKEFSGFSREQMTSEPFTFFDSIHPDDKELAQEKVSESAANMQDYKLEHRIVKPSGEIAWFTVKSSPQKLENGDIIWTGISLDITEKKEIESRLKESLREKETLLQEIHHRVKNNMQIIASLLRLQVRQQDSREVQNILRDNIGRVYSMSAIHENLYRSDELSEIDFRSFVMQLAQNLLQTYSVQPDKVALEFESPDLKLNINKANPLGMVLNELISNALKYAFPGERRGTLSINTMLKENSNLEIAIADDGIGLPPDVDWDTSSTLGLQLIKDLVENQLDGTIQKENKNGARFVIQFSLTMDEAR